MAEWENACHKIAVSIIIARDGKILLLKECEGYWQPPGGGVNQGETPKEALLRELKEETGEIRIKEQIYPVDIRTAFHRVKLIGIAFVAEYLSGEVQLSEENTEFGWFTLREIEDRKLELGMPFEVLKKAMYVLERLRL